MKRARAAAAVATVVLVAAGLHFLAIIAASCAASAVVIPLWLLCRNVSDVFGLIVSVPAGVVAWIYVWRRVKGWGQALWL